MRSKVVFTPHGMSPTWRPDVARPENITRWYENELLPHGMSNDRSFGQAIAWKLQDIDLAYELLCNNES